MRYVYYSASSGESKKRHDLSMRYDFIQDNVQIVTTYDRSGSFGDHRRLLRAGYDHVANVTTV